jgi:hypothetical protein
MADLARTFVSFSSTDINYYRMMMAWNASEHIEFNFKDFQLEEALNTTSPSRIKAECARKIRMTDTFILLIGEDTFTKTEFVQAEVEAATEKGCRLIGMNLNDARYKDLLCPWFFAGIGALFIPYSCRIAARAVAPWNRPGGAQNLQRGNWEFYDQLYLDLGYELNGDTATLPEAPNPFAGGKRPSWAK